MANSVQETVAAHNLHEYGRVLDGMDAAKLPLCNRQYRKAALFAAMILQTHAASEVIREVCALSPSLTILLENARWDTDVTGLVDVRDLLNCR